MQFCFSSIISMLLFWLKICSVPSQNRGGIQLSISFKESLNRWDLNFLKELLISVYFCHKYCFLRLTQEHAVQIQAEICIWHGKGFSGYCATRVCYRSFEVNTAHLFPWKLGKLHFIKFCFLYLVEKECSHLLFLSTVMLFSIGALFACQHALVQRCVAS